MAKRKGEPWPLDANGQPVPSLPHGWPDFASVNWPRQNDGWAAVGADGRPVLAPARRKPLPTLGILGAIVGAVVLAGIVIGALAHGSSPVAAPRSVDTFTGLPPNDLPGAAPVKWWPAGFSPSTDDPDVAYKFVPEANLDCGNTGLGCFQMHVAVDQPCSSLYIELATINASGEKVGFTNATLGGMNPGDKGLMTFPVTDQGVVKGQISQVSCV